MNTKLLMKNIILFVFPLLIPVFILGSFAIVISDKYIKENITMNNQNVLQQLEQQVSVIFNEMYLLNLDYNWNPDIILSMKNLLNADGYNFEENTNSKIREGDVKSKEVATPYIESIYVYFSNDQNQVLTSREGVTNIDSFYDKDFMNSYDSTSTSRDIWTENRKVQQFPFQDAREVITLYKNIFWTNAKYSEGLIALNIEKDYFENIVNELNNYDRQRIVVLDDNHNIVFGNAYSNSLDNNFIDTFTPKSDQVFEFSYDGTAYVANQLISADNGWRFLSIVEKDVLYMLPNQLKKLTFLFIIFSLIAGTAVIYYLSRKNTKHVSNILSIIDQSKEKREEAPKNMSFRNDEYQYIVQNIVQNYINHNRLEKELNEKKYQLQSAELLALQSQINPHFLSNTLAIIYWRTLALTGRPNNATKMLEILSDILNFSLKIDDTTVPLIEEVEHTKRYVEIMKIRSKEDINIIWDYNERLKHLPVLKFCLQPLIENTMQHGVNSKQQADVCIKFKVKEVNGKLVISVTDNGLGMKKDRLIQVWNHILKQSQPTSHIGLANIYKRLSLIYENQFTFQILSKANYGTMIKISHPIDKNIEDSGAEVLPSES
ncbi:sensor histidine kinase [Saliterribacillus persicus]|uniref:Two-component system sensor histidine kinase YesM n=1 Tax=Saliterribacillus persicus TaxID=930114 RepID=A0A368Y584_9BACI|nr:sensor histidine kinase [Saliterribacillus persicus]RCW74909.1 two-component system sensor histidine kinase YesM [Saliterribacillus persicus]